MDSEEHPERHLTPEIWPQHEELLLESYRLSSCSAQNSHSDSGRRTFTALKKNHEPFQTRVVMLLIICMVIKVYSSGLFSRFVVCLSFNWKHYEGNQHEMMTSFFIHVFFYNICSKHVTF